MIKKAVSSLLFIVSFNAYSDMSINYPNVPLSSLVETISVVTGKSFTYAVETGEVPLSLVMPGESSKDDVFQKFVESLKVSGLKAVETKNGLISVVPADFVASTDLSKDKFQTIVMTLKNIDAKDVAKALEKSLSTGGYIAPSGLKKVVIYDVLSNLPRIKTLILELDKTEIIIPVFETIILNNLKPSDIKAPDGLNLTAYDSVNRLVVHGLPDQVKAFKQSVYTLDQSVKTVYVRLLISTMTKDFVEEFNLVPLFQGGALSASLTSIAVNTLTLPQDGISVLLSLFKSHSQVQVQAKPFLQLLEGHLASFNVGREIPILVSTIDKDTGQSVRNVQRKKVGLSIDLLARVRPDGLINLDLSQNLSAISQQQLDQASDIITDDQSLKTQLLIAPGRVYAVGGLTDQRSVNSRSGLPFFSFLDSTKEGDQVQEIMIFIEASLTPFNQGAGASPQIGRQAVESVYGE